MKGRINTKNSYVDYQTVTYFGQSSCLVIVDEDGGKYYYEWQGIFRRGSGAERLFVEEIIS